MTIVSTAPSVNGSSAPDVTSAIVAEFAGGQSNDVQMMIGVGLVKDSDAVFFQYVGEDASPRALTLPSNGKPLTRMPNVRLAGIDVADDIGEFKSTKLNLFLETTAGRTIMLTSGLTTIWSQCIITALMGLVDNYDVHTAFTLDSWKGNSKMRPCFAAIRVGKEKVSCQEIYDQLKDYRADRASDKVESLMRDAINILNATLGTDAQIDEVVVSETTEEEF